METTSRFISIQDCIPPSIVDHLSYTRLCRNISSLSPLSKQTHRRKPDPRSAAPTRPRGPRIDRQARSLVSLHPPSPLSLPSVPLSACPPTLSRNQNPSSAPQQASPQRLSFPTRTTSLSKERVRRRFFPGALKSRVGFLRRSAVSLSSFLALFG